VNSCKLIGSAAAVALAGTDGESHLFAETGNTLVAAIAVCDRDECIATPIAPAGWTEEVGAVVKGRFELVFDDETRTLDAGQAAAIDQGQPHVWRCLSDDGVLYRVALKAIDNPR
jgi:mannose-6-phosphate isomerase-like protein (cupin superfamily)